MTDYLLIECIINNLVHDEIIDPPPAAWKKTAIETQFYYADFVRAKGGNLLSFRISVINEKHVISTTAFINQAKFFNINPARILDECKLR